ncbi:hypothetical protein [Staphylococcus aureus subsp. aureus N315]|nr:hypothetical protein SA2981_1433 [Staphylococcus aureus 04-02981]BAB42570.1 hypothetical protein [Staphylococcus aureus subsp. aureus N315]BAB57639.1 hypothetical protein SAV1477 [Staphylococcus aureus subsp. aureus Mu50]BAF78348.1 hypothetical protein SAHV_1465 [Staphylococcus aureus subsp. aureus Mu3]
MMNESCLFIFGKSSCVSELCKFFKK